MQEDPPPARTRWTTGAEGVALQDASRPGTAAELAGLRDALEREV